MIIRVQPLPDEMGAGYLGRLMRINGAAFAEQLLALLRGWYEGYLPASSARPIDIIAQVLGLSPEGLLMRHSTFPFYQAFTTNEPSRSYASKLSGYYSLIRALTSGRGEGYFCTHCVAEDLDFHGVSYWRRSHQMPGVFWCQKHGEGLYRVQHPRAFWQSPANFVDCASKIADSWVESAKDNIHVQRALDISFGLLDRPMAVSVQQVRAVLTLRAAMRNLNFRNNPRSPLPTLFDYIVQKVGRTWLDAFLPAPTRLHSRPQEQLFRQSHSSLYVFEHVLAAAVLYPSCHDALNCLNGHEVFSVPVRDLEGLSRDQMIYEIYAATRGSHAQTVAALQETGLDTSACLKALGLPDFECKDTSTSIILAAKAFFIDGRTLSQSVAIAGISHDFFGEILRIVGMPFTKQVINPAISERDRLVGFFVGLSKKSRKFANERFGGMTCPLGMEDAALIVD